MSFSLTGSTLLRRVAAKILGGNFVPSSLPGVAAWLSADTNVLTDGAAQFTLAQNQYLQLDTTPAAFKADQGDFSVVGWFYADSVAPTTQRLVGKLISIVDTQMDWDVSLSSSSIGFSMFSSGASSAATGVGGVTAGAWNFFGARYNSATRALDFRFNAANATQVFLTAAPSTSSARLRFGCRDNAGALNPFGGRMDSTAFYSRRLADAELDALYNSGNGLTYEQTSTAQKTGLVAWWNLDERTGTRFDSHTGGYNLSANGDAIITPSVLNGGFETAGTNGGTIVWTATASRARLTNVATIVTGSAHGLSTGNVISMLNMGGTGYNLSSVTVTVLNSTSFTYASPGTDETLIADTAGRINTNPFANWNYSLSNTTTGRIGVETGVVHSGTNSMRFEIDAGNGFVSAQPGSSLILGATYTVSFWARATVGTSSLKVVDFSNGSTTYPNISGGSCDTGGLSTSAWTQYTYSFVANSAILGIQRNAGTAANIYIDDVTLTTAGPTTNIGIAAGIASDGDPVKNWTCAVTGCVASQLTLSSKPVYVANGINSKPSISFDGVDDRLDLTAIDMSGDMTIFVVEKVNVVGVGQNIFGNRFAASSSDQVFTVQITNGGNWQTGLANSAGTFSQFPAVTGNVVSGAVSLLSSTREYTNLAAQTFLNGTGGTRLTGLSYPVRTTSLSYIGRDNVTNAFGGLVSEVIVYNRLLTQAERWAVEGYLASKYGLTVAQT